MSDVRTLVLVFPCVAILAACPPSAVTPAEDAGPTDAGDTRPDGGFDPGTDAGTADAGGTDAGVALPVITSVTLITHGSIRVQWTNPTPPCDTLTLVRAKDGAAGVAAAQPAPTSTEFMDAPGHASGTYCYSLTCLRAGATDGSSNQSCASQ